MFRLSGIFQDIRYAVRTLARSPGFTLIAIATLAVGIGINTAGFTITNAVLFKGFPGVYRNDRIVYLMEFRGANLSYPDFEDWRHQAKSFKGMALVRNNWDTLSVRGYSASSVNATQVTANAFGLLHVKPMLGRDFTSADEQPGAAPTAILRYRFWQHQFAKDPDVIGQTVRLNDIPTTIIGVMPPGFSFPTDQQLWVPLVPTPALRKRDNRNNWFAFGRLADGVSIQSARSEMQAIGRRLANTYLRADKGIAPYVWTFNQLFVRDLTSTYRALWGAVGFVLLIACANVANLLLGRAMRRSREISVRAALGAGSWRIVRQLLVESMLLSSVGTIVGWGVAELAVRVYTLTAAPAFDAVLDYGMDYRVLLYVVATAIGTALLFGLAPALRLARLDVNAGLKDGDRTIGGRRGRRLPLLLVTVEAALAVVLLAGAGFMIRSFVNVDTANVGVRPAGVLAAQVVLPLEKYPDAKTQGAFYDRLEARLRAMPGVESAALATVAPKYFTPRDSYEVAGAPTAASGRTDKIANLAIGTGYFRTLSSTVLAGRTFNDSDRAGGAPVAIVNERFADQHWPGQNSVGKRILLFDGKQRSVWRTVVGVVSNIVQNDLTGQHFGPLVYIPYRQRPRSAMTILVRSRFSPATVAHEIRQQLHQIDAALPLTHVKPLAEALRQSARYQRSFAILLTSFAAIALLLASVGLYAAIARAVNQRTREIGIRMAMGATAGEIRKLVFREGLLPLGAGLGIGLVASLAVNRLLEHELVGVSPTDAVTLITVSAVLISAGVLGALIPARRATRVDPLVALRHE